MATKRDQGPGSVDDLGRLIHEVLRKVGSLADPDQVARIVCGLDRGLPAEDEFGVICAWLGECKILHKLDQQQVPLSSALTYQVPDLLAAFNSAGPFLIEVKVKKDGKLSFRPDYLDRLTAYAKLVGLPLLIAWKWNGLWTLFDVRHLRRARINFNVALSEAMKQNLLGMLAGDVAYSMGSGAGVHFDSAKEELVSVGSENGRQIEEWKLRITDAFLTDGAGRRRDDLHAETQQLFAGCDLEARTEDLADRIRHSFVPRESGIQFAHGALVQLLEWELPSGAQLNWRHLLRSPTILRSIADFRAALDRGLQEGIIHHIFHQRPVDPPHFLSMEGRSQRHGDVASDADDSN